MRVFAVRHSGGFLGRFFRTSVGVVGAMIVSGCAATIPDSDKMVAAGESPQPAAYGALCQRHPDLCDLGAAASSSSEKAVLALSEAKFEILETVNSQVNRRITYRKDVEVYGVSEHWTPAQRVGDCEDYALTKLTELIAAGVPRRVMRLATVKQRDGVPHAVLTVHTNKGVYVLDNKYDYVVPWKQLGYRNWRWEQPGSFRWQTLTGDQLASTGS